MNSEIFWFPSVSSVPLPLASVWPKLVFSIDDSPLETPLPDQPLAYSPQACPRVQPTSAFLELSLQFEFFVMHQHLDDFIGWLRSPPDPIGLLDHKLDRLVPCFLHVIVSIAHGDQALSVLFRQSLRAALTWSEHQTNPR
jgi:hypothetical protein